jgi:tetratricopeptide (TPR) repeat protein
LYDEWDNQVPSTKPTILCLLPLVDHCESTFRILNLVKRIGCITLLLIANGCVALKPFQAAGRSSMAQRISQQWNNVGLDALNTGKLSQAKSFFSRAAAEDPKDGLARVNLARTLRKENDLAAGLIEMQKGVELTGGRDPKLIAELGEMYLDAGQWIQANHHAELAIQIDHRCAAAWALRGRVQHAKGDYQTALANYQRAASLDSDLPSVQLSIAEVYHDLGEPLRALSAIEKVLQKYPLDQQSEAVLLAKGEVLMDLQQLNAAIEVLQSASERPDASSTTYLRLAEAQVTSGQISQARQTLNRGRELHPQVLHFEERLSALPTDSDQIAIR